MGRSLRPLESKTTAQLIALEDAEINEANSYFADGGSIPPEFGLALHHIALEKAARRVVTPFQGVSIPQLRREMEVTEAEKQQASEPIEFAKLVIRAANIAREFDRLAAERTFRKAA